MWISDTSIARPVLTVVSMLALVLFGLVALIFLDTDEYPEVNPPVVVLAMPYPGAAPAVVERELVTPVEDALSGISGVDSMRSSSLDGFGMVVVEFEFEKDLQQATQDIRDKLGEIRGDLPAEIEEPILTRWDPNELPIVTLALSSPTRTTAELTRIADPDLTGRLQGIAGVAAVTMVGEQEPELSVALDPDALAAAGVGVQQVVGALSAGNLAVPVGRVTDGQIERSIRLLGRPERPDEFEEIAVATVRDRLIRLGDVATVSASAEEARSLALFDDRPAVGIEIVKSTAASTTAVSDALRLVVDGIRKDLPPDVTLDVVRDGGERVRDSVRSVQETLVEGAILTVVVVFLFLNSWRSTVITGLSLPVSVISAFTMVYAFGFTLNSMSLLGLSLAIGILVDDAIVVRENIVRHMERGKGHFEAARDGTAEIGPAVAATTLSIVVVFVPVAFMGGLAEQFLGPMALTVASSVAVSLFVSFSLDPMLSAWWPDPAVAHDARRGFVGRQVARFNAFVDGLTTRYQAVIRWALAHRKSTFALTVAAFAGALAIPATGLVGSSFFPIQDRSEFLVRMEMPPGTSLSYMREKSEEAARVARTFEDVLYSFTTVGGVGGTVDSAEMYVRLVPKADRDRHQDDIAADVAREVRRLAGLEVAVTGTGFRNEKQIQVQLTGPDIGVLSRLADALAERVRDVPGAVDVGLSTGRQKPELSVELDRELASRLGLTVGSVAQALRPAFAGLDVGDWVDPEGDTRDVVVRLAGDARTRREHLADLPVAVPGPTGSVVLPLSAIASVTQGLGPAEIAHSDRERVIAVEANARGLPLSAVLEGIDAILAEVPMPPGYAVVQGGEAERQGDVFGRMLASLGVALVMMYFVLVVQYGSFLTPVPILMSLPLSLVGVMLGLWVTGQTVNLMSMIGIVLLMGIVAKNAILLIDFARSAEDAGVPRREALIEAGGMRLRPILMTSVAIVAGMIPVAVGGGEGADFRAPLGVAVIGGVITSTLLTLLVVPTLYDAISSVWEWTWRRVRPLFLASDAGAAVGR